MKYTLTFLTTCLIAMALLAGCKGSSETTGFFGGDEAVVARLPAGGGDSGGDNPGSGDPGNGGGDPGNGGGDPGNGGGGHSPEPATLALLGSGLLAYALLRRRKRK